MIYNKAYFNTLRDTIGNTVNFNELKEKTILITGSNGLIGSAIIDTLIYANKNKGMNIRIIAAGRNENKIKERFGEYYLNEDLTFVHYDATKPINFNFNIDYIIHAASNAHPLAYSKYPVETMLSNFYGVNNLLEYMRGHKDSRLLYISSSEVYGKKEDDKEYFEEDYGYVDILNSRSCYPSSKRASETLCASYSQEYGNDVVIVRPGHIYGPTMTKEDSRASAQFIRNSLNKEDIILKSPGLQKRSYCYVFDTVSAILTVLLNGKSGEAYNISNKNSQVTIRELAEALANYVGRKLRFENPSDIEAKGYNLMDNSVLNNDKLELLGWQGLFSLEEGVKDLLEILTLRMRL